MASHQQKKKKDFGDVEEGNRKFFFFFWTHKSQAVLSVTSESKKGLSIAVLGPRHDVQRLQATKATSWRFVALCTKEYVGTTKNGDLYSSGPSHPYRRGKKVTQLVLKPG